VIPDGILMPCRRARSSIQTGEVWTRGFLNVRHHHKPPTGSRHTQNVDGSGVAPYGGLRAKHENRPNRGTTIVSGTSPALPSETMVVGAR